MSDPTFPETFVVQRDEDVSGISGEGVVAEGVQFSDGWVATHWLDKPPMHQPKTDVWHNKGTAPFERIHGHDGRTRIVWADDVEAARGKAVADVAEAFDVPAHLLGTEAELTYLREQIGRALVNAARHAQWGEDQRPRWTHLSGDHGEFVDALMPIAELLLGERARAQRAAGRAYQLADRWQAAHGSSMFLVRAAGAELHDELDGAPGPTGIRGLLEHVGIDTCGRHITVAGRVVDAAPTPPAVARVRRDPRADDPSYDPIEGDGTGQKVGLLAAAGMAGPEPDRADDPAGLRQQYAAALWQANGPDAAADANVAAVLAVRDRELEKVRAAREQLRAQRNDLAQALREALAAFRAVNDEATRATVGYVSAPIHPCNFDRWREVLAQAPANCRKPGGCADCPHETEA